LDNANLQKILANIELIYKNDFGTNSHHEYTEIMHLYLNLILPYPDGLIDLYNEMSVNN